MTFIKMLKNSKEKGKRALFFLSLNIYQAPTWQLSAFPEPFRCGLPQNSSDDLRRLDGPPMPARRHAPWARELAYFTLDFPVSVAADPGSSLAPGALGTLGAWKPRGANHLLPGHVSDFLKCQKGVYILGSQSPLLSTSVRGQAAFCSRPTSGFASAHLHQDSVPPKFPF